MIKSESKSFYNQITLSQIAYPGDFSYDVIYYKLDLYITYNPNYISGAVTINAKGNSQFIDSLFVDLQNVLDVDSVLSNNTKLNFAHSENKIFIKLNKKYKFGEEFSFIIYYKGVPGSSGFGSFEFSQHNNGQPVIWSLSEPYGSSDWWPCKDTPADKADSADIWIRCDSSLIPISNGKLLEIINLGDGTHQYKWKSHYPIAQYLISVAITNYYQYIQYFKYSETDSMMVLHNVYPEHFNNIKSELDKTVNMLEIFSDKYGLYPFIKEKYGHAQFGWGGGMEHQTCTSLGSFGEGIISHELAHQWFGDKVTCKDWHHIWLNEGFATFSEAVYVEEVYGKEAYKNQLINEMNYAKSAVGSIYVEDISSVDEIFNGARSYSKGGVVLHMLRGIVGDSIFFAILRNYHNDPELAYNVATTEDFQRVAENTSGMDLNYFFDEWIYGYYYPKYSVSWDYQLIENDMYKVDININQTVNSNPEFFTMPIQIKIKTTNGDTLFTVFNDQQSQSFSFTVKGNPQSLIFDPENFILKELNLFTSIDDKISVPTEYSLSQNYPNPFNPTTNIKYSLKSDEKVTIKIYNTLGEEVMTLVDEIKPAGIYEAEFNANSLTSGVYMYRMQTSNYISTKKMLLVK
ncbi:MAG: M1 family aminopeptidase [Ignavibacterium sp.]